MSEETFVRELERRADDIHGAPLTFETVRGRARQLRRRRRTVVAAGAAAAVAVAILVPAVLTGGSGGDSAPDPAPQPATPGTSVLHDGTLTLPGGDTVRLDVDIAHITELGVLTDGRIVAALQVPNVVRVYAADGTEQATYRPAANTITMSAGDDAVAWVDRDNTVRVLTSGVAEPAALPGIPMPGGAAGSIDAVLDPGHLLVGDHTTTTGMLTPDGVTELDTPEQFRVVDVDPAGDLWAVTFLPTEEQQDGCAGLYDPEAREIVKRSCDVHPLAFAPDGEHLLSGYVENNMAGDVTTYDLDLDVVGTVDPDGDTTVVSRAAWADAEHLLVAVVDWQRSTWSLVRTGLDGSDPEVVVPETPGDNPEVAAEFMLSE